MNDLRKEIDEMIGLTGYTEPPGTTAPGTEPPGTEAPSTEAPETGAPATEIPETEPPSTEAPTTEAPPDEFEKLREENRKLRADFEALSKKVTPSPTQAPSTEAPISEIDFVGDTDLDELTRDAGSFNKILNKVYQQGAKDARTEREKTLRSIPDITRTNVNLAINLRKASEDFYRDNKDLAPFKKTVAAVYEELASENPEKTVVEIMKDVGLEARRRLDLHKKATQNERRQPHLPRKKGQQPRKSQHKPDTDPLLAEIDEMNKSLEE